MNTATASLPSRPVTEPATRPDRRGLHIALWVAQALLAAMFLMSGFMKATTPFDELGKVMSFAPVMGEAVTRFIGVSEILGAIGLVLPAATRVRPWLTPLAAAALALVMCLAVAFHVTHNEIGIVPVNLVLGGLAAFIAWGRFVAAPISERAA